jgi:SAM-dependent methyltransferase
MNLDWPPRDEPEPGEEYASYAEVYDLLFDDLDKDVGFYLEAARKHLPPAGTLLELGVGTGRLTWRLLEAGYDVVGVDPSEPMITRAAVRLAPYAPRGQLVHANAQAVRLGRKFGLAIAPYGMVAHLHDDDERLAVYRNVHDHLQPGGVFVFDDMPGWMAGPSDGSKLDLYRTARDPATDLDVRLMTNMVDVAGNPLTVRYDFIDWLNAAGEVARRIIVRVRFRNIALADEMALLRRAGFGHVELLGGFDGRPLKLDDLSANTRLIMSCRRG